jgi:two-component system CheB/CheR fusion protein
VLGPYDRKTQTATRTAFCDACVTYSKLEMMAKLSLTAPDSTAAAFPVVGIGASSSAQRSLEAFFAALPATTGAAFVVVYEDDSASALSTPRSTPRVPSAMPVDLVGGIATLAPNRVYVVAPACAVELSGAQLQVSPRAALQPPGATIDLFFRSLAKTHGAWAVGIDLSGAVDRVGVRYLRSCGALSISGIPSHGRRAINERPAADAATVDLVLPAADIPEYLVRLWASTPDVRVPGARPRSGADIERAEHALREILITLRSRTGHDFRHYKRTVVLKRIERRLRITGHRDLVGYCEFLQTYASETPALLRDMLDGATHFLRDPAAYESLRSRLLPAMFADRSPADAIRVWSAGCASGEEAYALAMLLQESADDAGSNASFQVFATDVDENAIAFARDGRYSSSSVADLDPAWLDRFFARDGADYRIRKEVRERILFAIQNVMRDPPFSRLDLLSCRNLLGSLEREAQQQILRKFHFALRPGGHLVLGPGENADVDGLFSLVDEAACLYRANVVDGAHGGHYAAKALALPDPTNAALAVRASKQRQAYADLHRRLLEQCAPASVLVNRDSEIIHLSDRAGCFLHYAGGAPSHNLLAAVRPELQHELRSAIYQALQTQRSVETPRVRLERDGEVTLVKSVVRPVRDDEADTDFVLILFDEVQACMPEEQPGAPLEAATQAQRELRRTKQQLLQTIAYYEGAVLALAESNDALQDTNEGLRSMTEELEASKEELQAINEALSALNDTLSEELDQTRTTNDDLQTLIDSAGMATILVDRDLRIVRFTPPANALFSLVAADVGRSLADIRHRLHEDALLDAVIATIDSGAPVERKLSSDDGRWYLARFAPSRRLDGGVAGAVLSFVDVTALHAADDARPPNGANALPGMPTATPDARFTPR